MLKHEPERMPMTVITCLSHPVSVLFVDDNESFLDTLAHDLRAQGRLITCAKPHKALEILKQSNEDVSDIIKQADDLDSDSASRYQIDFHLNQIPQILYNPKRNQFIGVAVIDYDMPKMNGIKLAEQLSDSPVGKMILTMEGDEALAVEAFNDHSIDQYLFKSLDDKMYKDLVAAIEKLKQTYFKRLSQDIMGVLSKSFKALIKTPGFQAIFDQVCKDSSAVEYYLVDQHGSFLFLDKEVNPTWLVVQDNQTIDTIAAMLEASDVDQSIVNALKQREKILFLPSDEDYKRSQALQDNLFKATRLDEDHFYCVAKGKITQLIDWDKVKPCASS